MRADDFNTLWLSLGTFQNLLTIKQDPPMSLTANHLIALYCRRLAIFVLAVLLGHALSRPASAQTTNFFYENATVTNNVAVGVGGIWDTTSLFWASPQTNSTPLGAWSNGATNVAEFNNTLSSGYTVNLLSNSDTSNGVMGAPITANSIIFNGDQIQTPDASDTVAYVLSSTTGTSQQTLNLSAGTITYNYVSQSGSGKSAGIMTALFNCNVDTPGDMTVNVTGKPEGSATGAFGDTSTTFTGNNSIGGNLNIGAGVNGLTGTGANTVYVDSQLALGSSTGLGSGYDPAANPNGTYNASAAIRFTGNNSAFAVATANTPVTVTVNNNFIINPAVTSGTYTPGTFLARIGATGGAGGINPNTLIVNGAISGFGDLQISAGFSGGTGTVVLNAQNTYKGQTYFNAGQAGIVQLGINNALPVTTDLIMSYTSGNGGILDLNGFNQTLNSLSTNLAGGTSYITNSGGQFSGQMSTLTINGSNSPGAFSLPINDGNAPIALVRAGTGTTILSYNGVSYSSYSGGTTISGGTLQIDFDSPNVGGFGELGAVPQSASTNIVINGGTLAAAASFTLNSNRGIALGPTIGSAAGMINVFAGKTLIYNGAMTDNGGSGGLTLTGPGTLSLGGTNTYSGPTLINAGVLSLSSVGSLTTSNVTVGVSGTLAGTGTIGGTTIVNGTIAPGSATQAGTLRTNGGLTLNGGGSYTWKLADGGTGGDLINVNSGAGTLTLNNTSGNKFTINVLPVPGGITNFSNATSYSWPIISAGTLAGNSFNPNLFNVNATGFSVGIPGSTWTISNSAGGTLSLNYNSVVPLYWQQTTGGSGNWTSSGGASWTDVNGMNSGAWDSTKTADFKSGSGTVTLQNPISSANGIQFETDGYLIQAAAPSDTLSAPAISVVNSGQTATISAALTGVNLQKSGLGTLILSGANSLSGTISIAGGTVQGPAASLAANVNVFATGTLAFDQPLAAPGNYSNAISGGGTVIKQDTGALTLSGNNSTFTGTLSLNQRNPCSGVRCGIRQRDQHHGFEWRHAGIHFRIHHRQPGCDTAGAVRKLPRQLHFAHVHGQ